MNQQTEMIIDAVPTGTALRGLPEEGARAVRTRKGVPMSRDLKERAIRWTLTGVACVSLLSLACIMLFLFMEGLPLFADYP